MVAEPLTALTSYKAKFNWTLTAENVFNELKTHFTFASTLCRPDSYCQFIVEVDASDGIVGAVLFERPETDQKLHAFAFLFEQIPKIWRTSAQQRD